MKNHNTKMHEAATTRLNTAEFIKRASLIHNHYYDYSKSDYYNWTTKLTIICPTHGEFLQRADSHMSGQGCPKCKSVQPKSIDELKKLAIEKHGNKYNYDKSIYINAKTKTTITCPTHGEFYQLWSAHIRGNGCIKCRNATASKTNTLTLQQFIDRANVIHSFKYCYSLTNYINKKHKVIIICPKHGEFTRIASEHLRGRGCPKCGTSLSDSEIQELLIKRNTYYINDNSVFCKIHGKMLFSVNEFYKQKGCPKCAKNKASFNDFINKANCIHGGIYEYSDYKNLLEPVEILCRKHGPFTITPSSHLRGKRCEQCDIDDILAKLHIIHSNRYTYTLKSKLKSSIISIICPRHGEFQQTLQNHMTGAKCRKCAYDDLSLNTRKTKEQFVNDAEMIHGKLYGYANAEYVNTDTPVSVICPKHGAFNIKPADHLNYCGCPQCSTSSRQLEIYNYIKNKTNNQLSLNDRTAIKPYEIDIYCDQLKLGIEYHGLYYHSYNRKEDTIERNKHKLKADLADLHQITILQFWESEWKNKTEIVKSIINNKLGLSNKSYARNLKIVDNIRCTEFMNNNHLQGHKNYYYSVGLFNDDELLSCMTFSKHKQYQWEIARFATKLGESVIGGASRLFTHFIRKHAPHTVLTFADRRYSVGNTYEKLGFIRVCTTRPNYFYIKGSKLYSRIKFQKHKLKQLLPDFDEALSESDNMFNNGYRRLWDAGHVKLIYKRPLQ